MENNYNTMLKIQLLNELSRLDLKFPIAVKNAISDVFDENDDLTADNLDINIYKKQDIDELNLDMKVFTNIDIDIDDNITKFSFVKVYSYYSKYQFRYNESIKCVANNDNITISELEQSNNKLLDVNDYLVCLLEEHSFDGMLYSKKYNLMIYLPI